MIRAHIFLDGDLVIRRHFENCPRVGDTMRFDDDVYGIVTEFIWCMDEVKSRDNPYQRVNIRVEKEKK